MDNQKKWTKKKTIMLSLCVAVVILIALFKILNTGDDSHYSAATDTQVA